MQRVINGFKLESTGRILSAYGGVVGLGPNGFIGGGFDQTLFDPEASDCGQAEDNLTDAERVEIAAAMVAEWSHISDAALRAAFARGAEAMREKVARHAAGAREESLTMKHVRSVPIPEYRE